jgi:hypothetical protein
VLSKNDDWLYYGCDNEITIEAMMALAFMDSFVNFYSINNNSLLFRCFPLQDTDAVPLGYSSTIAGDFSVSIIKTDGVLSTMPVYLEDKLTNRTHNLKSGPYTF